MVELFCAIIKKHGRYLVTVSPELSVKMKTIGHLFDLVKETFIF